MMIGDDLVIAHPAFSDSKKCCVTVYRKGQGWILIARRDFDASTSADRDDLALSVETLARQMVQDYEIREQRRQWMDEISKSDFVRNQFDGSDDD